MFCLYKDFGYLKKIISLNSRLSKAQTSCTLTHSIHSVGEIRDLK